MSIYGVKIWNFVAGSIYEVNHGVRENYDMKPAMLTNSLFKDFMDKHGLKTWKGESTRDIICIEFKYGSRSYEDENKQSFDIDLEPELKVNVEWYITGNNDVDILFKTMSKQKLWLHWGVSQGNDGKNWSRIEKSYYPALTYEFQETSLQTEFSYLEQDDLEQKIHIRFPKTHVHSFNFVFLEKEKNKWYNNNEQDYHLQIN